MKSIILLLVSASFISASYWLEEKMTIEEPATVEGEVSMIKKDGFNDDGDAMHKSFFTFSVDGDEYTIESMGKTNNPGEVGDTVEIKYSQANPEEAYRNDGFVGFFNNYAPDLFFWCGVGAAVFLSFSILAVIASAL